MGQKVNPHGLRVGVIKDWDSKWYANKKEFSGYLVEDHKIREFINKRLHSAGVSRTLIDRAANNQIKITILTGKPGMVIGRSGTGIDELKAAIEKLTGKSTVINIVEIRRIELDAQLTAESIAQALERRISYRRAMKQAIGRTMKAGAKGIKVLVSGRLGGAEIARNEKYSEGNVPLHTLRANINYGFAEANTTYGKLGIKVWINHGEILEKGLKSAIPDDKPERGGDRRRNDRQRRDKDKRRKDSDGFRRDDRRGPRGEGGTVEKRAENPRKKATPKPPAPAPQVEEVKAEAPVAEAENKQ